MLPAEMQSCQGRLLCRPRWGRCWTSYLASGLMSSDTTKYDHNIMPVSGRDVTEVLLRLSSKHGRCELIEDMQADICNSS